MKKYQWNNPEMQSRAKMLQWLELLFALVALALYFMGASPWWILGCGICVVLFYLWAWKIQKDDSKLKQKN